MYAVSWHCNRARAVPVASNRVRSREILENSTDFKRFKKKALKLRKKFWSVQADSIAEVVILRFLFKPKLADRPTHCDPVHQSFASQKVTIKQAVEGALVGFLSAD